METEKMVLEDKDLKKLHETLLIIMDEFGRICKKHGIPYFLDSGSALGAVRHKGFIHWDDDVDIGMLREDYLKFMEVAAKELDKEFFLQTHDTDPNYFRFHAKIRMNNTFFPEKNTDHLAHRGIFIDIFPFDYVSDDERVALREIKKARWLFRFVLFTRPGYKPGVIRKKVIQMVLKLTNYDRNRDRYVKHITKHFASPTKHVTCFPYYALAKKDLVFELNDVRGGNYVEFEDREYQAMQNPDAYLTTMYGDYMTLPPEEDRTYHANGKIVFPGKEAE